ncbi:MAG: hypothetical protein GXO22_07095 [Aquificae bacterium]|nr:hypothetical protein [Aquificota bacterium]
MFNLIDTAIFGLIVIIISLYGLLRYKEEKIKENEKKLPELLKLKQKWIEERDSFEKKAQSLKEKIKQKNQQIKTLKSNLKNFRWTEEDIENFKFMRGTELQYYLSTIFLLKGYNVYDPPIFKDCNIDIIVEKNKEKICIAFVDRVKIRKLDFSFLRRLKEGKEKYNCKEIWILTNSTIEKTLKSSKLLNMEWIIQNFPPPKAIKEYEALTTQLHNLELMYEETVHEVIRRNTWLKELEQKIQKEIEKRQLDPKRVTYAKPTNQKISKNSD